VKLPTTKRDAPVAIWRRWGLTIQPANDIAEAMLRTLKSGDEFVGRFQRKRSLKQLRLWWGLMRLLVDHGEFPSLESASDATKIASGHTQILIFPDTGEAVMLPLSISFGSLPQDEFQRVFEVALEVICSRWIIGVGKETLQKEVFRAIDGPSAIGERIIKSERKTS